MTAMNSIKILKLLQGLLRLSRLQNPRSLSSFAEVDRSTWHTAVTPCLFRNIEVCLDSVESLAEALCNNPDRAASCMSLAFRDKFREREPVLDGSAMQKLYTDLITVLA
jgi:hypothetical protein